jgi:ABC-type multidrug transport system permease subunit
MTKTLVVAEMAARDLSRRRGALTLLFLLPLAFYVARRDMTGQAVRLVGLGLGWVVSTAAVFSGTAAKGLEPRLRLTGYRTRHLVAGRLTALVTIALAVGAVYLAIALLDQDIRRPGAVALGLLLTVAVAVPLGLLMAALLPRELEAMLVLLTVFGLQMLLDPATMSARLLPFWSLRELATYAIDMVDASYLRRGALHGATVAVTLVALFAVMSTVRLRRRPHLRLRPASSDA